MNNDELYTNVKNRLPQLSCLTVNEIQSRYHVLQYQARACLAKLQAEGRVSKIWDQKIGGYAVIQREMINNTIT